MLSVEGLSRETAANEDLMIHETPRDLNPLIIIPARMASSRLPGKPLADIAGAPMIVQCWRRAMEAEIGPVVVACAEDEIAEAVERAGGTAILTRPDHPSGSDRIFEALAHYDTEERYNAVVNLQGDLPTIDPRIIRRVLTPLSDAQVDIATLVVEIKVSEERSNPNVVKAAVQFPGDTKVARALYFSRSPVPWAGADDNGPLYHHVGIYAYRRPALARFVALPPSPLEKRERLEQLRALENGMIIAAARVDTVPLGVDTPADLAAARAVLQPEK